MIHSEQYSCTEYFDFAQYKQCRSMTAKNKIKHMKNIFFVLFLFPVFCFSQHTISGVLIDSKTAEVLPFATIITNHNQGVITNVDGNLHDRRTFIDLKNIDNRVSSLWTNY